MGSGLVSISHEELPFALEDSDRFVSSISGLQSISNSSTSSLPRPVRLVAQNSPYTCTGHQEPSNSRISVASQNTTVAVIKAAPPPQDVCMDCQLSTSSVRLLRRERLRCSRRAAPTRAMAGRGRGAALTVPAWMKDRDRAASSSGQAPSADLPAPLPAHRPIAVAPVSDWARAVAATGRPYWYSRATGETTWVDPTATVASSGGAPSTPGVATAAFATAATASPDAKALWAKNTAANGKTYYYNRETRETSWKPPPGFADDADAAAIPSAPPNGLSTVAQQRAVASGSTAAAEVQKPASSREASAVASSQFAADTAGAMPPGWAAYKSQDGKEYFHHAGTGVTVWQRPGHTAVPSISPPTLSIPSLTTSSQGPLATANVGSMPGSRKHELPSPTTAPTTAPPQHVVPLPLRAEKRRRRTRYAPRGYVVRPKNKDGTRYLDDKETEAHFLARAEKERARLAEVARKARIAAGKGERGLVCGRARAKREHHSKTRNACEYVRLKKEQREPTAEQRKHFQIVMRDSHVSKGSSWLETIARCTPDERYLSDVDQFGHRKLVYTNYVAKLAKASRDQANIGKLRAEDDLNVLLNECFAGEPESVSALSECNPEAVRRFEADARYASADIAGDSSGDVRRANTILHYFLDRKRLMKEAKVTARRNMKGDLYRALDSFAVDLQADSRHRKARSDVSVADSAAAESSTGGWLTERTTLREVEEKLAGLREFGDLEPHEVADVYNVWIRAAKRRAVDRQTQERDAARHILADCRAAFAKGVEQMLLEGRLSFRAQWRDASKIVLEEAFGKNAAAMPQIGPLALLFEEGVRLFFRHVDAKADAFRSALRAAAPCPLVLTDELAVDDIRKMKSFAAALDGVPDAVAAALMHERRKKEARRKEYAIDVFEELLRRRDVDVSTDWAILKESIEGRTAYKELHDIIGGEGVKAVFDDLVLRREKRRKRHVEASEPQTRRGAPADSKGSSRRTAADVVASSSNLPPLKKTKRDTSAVQPAMLKPLPPSIAAISRRSGAREDADSGWAAALTAKPQGSAEHRAERERQKRELLGNRIDK
jgi:WW domain